MSLLVYEDDLRRQRLMTNDLQPYFAATTRASCPSFRKCEPAAVRACFVDDCWKVVCPSPCAPASFAVRAAIAASARAAAPASAASQIVELALWALVTVAIPAWGQKQLAVWARSSPQPERYAVPPLKVC